MKTKQNPILTWVLAVCAMQLALWSTHAQSNFLAHAFDTEAEVLDNGGNPWGNWFGTAFYQAVWAGGSAIDDANGDTSSGSLLIEAFFPDSGIGGCCGPQFLGYNQNDGFNPPVAGNGSGAGVPVATNLEFDLRFGAGSGYYTNQSTNANWPQIEVGTRGIDYGQHNFGSITFQATNESDLNTNWIHVSMPIAASDNWVTIPNIYFKHYGPNLSNWVYLHIDNIVFSMAEVEIPPPTMTMEKAQPGVRFYAGPSQYSRTQVGSADTNQSWVGGTYPVSYSFTLSDYDTDPSLNEFHVFLLPLNHVTEGAGLDQYTDYSTASNNFRLQMQGGDNGTPTVTAQLAYKTNAVNANPEEVVLTITNDTAAGTWTLQFNSATDGTLMAPGAASAAPFSLPADVAATFANPLVAIFGVQPNAGGVIGQHVDFTHIQTVGVASPGVAINSDFTTGSIDTNVWLTSVSADEANLVPVDVTTPWFVNWGFPDSGFVLSAKADIGDTNIAWKTPDYFSGYDTNNLVLKKTLGSRVESLIPEAALPTTDGTSNGVAGSSAYFRLENPAPAE